MIWTELGVLWIVVVVVVWTVLAAAVLVGDASVGLFGRVGEGRVCLAIGPPFLRGYERKWRKYYRHHRVDLLQEIAEYRDWISEMAS